MPVPCLEDEQQALCARIEAYCDNVLTEERFLQDSSYGEKFSAAVGHLKDMMGAGKDQMSLYTTQKELKWLWRDVQKTPDTHTPMRVAVILLLRAAYVLHNPVSPYCGIRGCKKRLDKIEALTPAFPARS